MPVTESLVIVGVGGFGRECLDVVVAINEKSSPAVWDVWGVVDDAPSDENLELLAARGYSYVGTVSDLLRHADPPRYVVAIGSPTARRRVVERLDEGGLQAATLVHPAATLGQPVRVGEGSIICAGSRVTTNISLGRHVHLNPNTTVGHDTTLGDFVSMNPAASVSGDCSIEEQVLIGVSAAILNGLQVGARATIGGCACVVKDVEPGQTMVGVPAKPLYEVTP